MGHKYRNREWLQQEYIKNDRTMADIADELGVHVSTISKWCNKYDLKKSSQRRLECPICGDMFERYQNRIERATYLNVCSRDCLYQARREGLLDWKNRILHGDARTMDEIPDGTIDLVVTSPPYNIGVDYDEVDDRQPLSEWRGLIRDVCQELYRITTADAKVCINVGASFGRTDVDGRYFRIPLNRHVIEIAQDVGFDMLDEFIWVKPSFSSHGGGALLGSYPYPTNVMVNHQHEYVLVFRKWTSEEHHATRDIPARGTPEREDSKLTKDEWREWTQSVWEIPPATSDAEADHPAMFPVELPTRLIRLYSFVDDLVLDPFVGSGTTAVAAVQTERQYVGYDISEKYCKMARERIQKHE